MSTSRPSLVRAALAVGGLRMAAQLMTWLVTLGTVRLLSPTDYGLSGLAMSLAAVLGTVVDLGLLPAIPAMPTQRRRVLAQAFGLVLLVSLILAVLTALSARPVAHLLRHDELAPLIPLAGALMLLEGVRAVPTAVALRDFRFTLVARTDFARAICQSLTTFLLAWTGAGPWSILGGAVLGTAVTLPWLVRGARLRPRWPEWATLRPLLGYARLLLTSRVTWQVWENADAFVIGRFVSAAAVGSFNVARTFAYMPMEKLLAVLFGVMTPYFAEQSGDPQSLRRYLLDLTELVSLLTGLPLVGLALVAPEVLPLIIGPQWDATIPLLRLLVPSAFFGALGVLATHLVNASGRAAVASNASTLAAISAVPCYALGASLFGAPGVAAMAVVVVGIVYLPVFRVALRDTQTSIGTYLLAFRAFALSAIAMGAAVLMLRWLLHRPALAAWNTPIPAALTLILGGATAALGTTWMTGGSGVARLRELVQDRLRARRQRAESISAS